MTSAVARLATVVAILLLAASPLAAQPGKKPWRIGILSYAGSAASDLIRDSLRQLGHVEGRDVTIELRDAEGRSDRLPLLAAELARLKVEIIVASGSAATRAAKDATAGIPIVMAPADDPVQNGFVASLARPGGQVTGVSVLSWTTGAKQVQLLKEAAPKLLRVAVLSVPANPGHEQAFREMQSPARALGVEIYRAAVRGPEEIDQAFSAMAKAQAGGGVLVLGDSMLTSERRRIVDLAARHRLPGIYFRKEFVEAGGLMSYGTDVAALVRHAATYIDKILKGASPGDIPVEQASRFELAINVRTASTLGLTIPPSLLLQAARVIR